jgi:hypothetical protein
METYKINDNLTFEAWYWKKGGRWGHEARAIWHGREIETARVTYQNRTWEAYTYQSVMEKLIDNLDQYKEIPLKDRIMASIFIKTGDDRELKALSMLGNLAKLAGIVGGNESKKAVLGTIQGLDIEALDGLDDQTVTDRLDGVINILTK